MRDPSAHPDFPPSGYITAAGTSRASAAEAASAARAGVVRQVRSTISAAVRREVDVERQGDDVSVRRRLLDQVEERSAFAHGELVRMDTAAAVQVAGVHYAFAFLSRQEADSVLAMDQAQAAERLREAHGRGGAAAAASDPGGVARAWRDFRTAEPAWMAVELQRRALTGRPAPDTGQVAAWSADFLAWAGALRDRSEWVVGLALGPGVPAEAATAAGRAIGGALTSLGLRAKMLPPEAGDPCTGGGHGPGPAGNALRYALTVAVEVGAATSALGPRREVSLRSDGRSCAGGGSFALDLSGGDTFGIHPSDPARALAAALRRLTPAAVAERLRGPLGELCPLP